MTLQLLKKSILTHEGLRLHPYKCTSGKLTIGCGRNLEDLGITFDEAMILLENDVYRSHSELAHFDWYLQLDDVRKEVLIELCFNIGLSKLLKFKKMIAALEKHNYPIAAAELLDSLWAKQVGKHRSNNMANRLLSGLYEID